MNYFRTEIVLKDAANVAFWFSFSFRFTTSSQRRQSKLPITDGHRIEVQPQVLGSNVAKKFRPAQDAGE